MKLNPFRKKSAGVLAKLQADYAQICETLEATERELAAARDERDAKVHASRHLEASNPGRTTLSSAEKAARLAANAAEQHVGTLALRLQRLKQEQISLRYRVEAPDQLVAAKATLSHLAQQGKALTAAREDTHKLITRIEQHIDALEARISAETQRASTSMIADQNEFAIPDALIRLDTELRVARITLADLCDRAKGLEAELGALPEQRREARHAFIHARAAVAHIELQEQLPALIELFARAAVSRNECDMSTPDDRYEVDLSRDVVEAMKARLETEMPAI